jgi:pimeloyl-ACP methyl ester carboxylesterase
MSSSSEKPVVVLVHGTWHQPIHFLLFLQRLRQEGFTVVAPHNPTSGWQDSVAEKSVKDDVKAVQDAIRPYLEAGRELVLVGHSYGSIPATDCVPGNSVEERKAKGLQGGIKAFLHIGAVVPLKAGITMMEQIALIPGGAEKYDPPPVWWGFDNNVSPSASSRSGAELMQWLTPS